MDRLMFSEICDGNEIYLEKNNKMYDKYIKELLKCSGFEHLKHFAYEKKDSVINAIFYVYVKRKKINISINAEIIKTFITNKSKNEYDKIFGGYNKMYSDFYNFQKLSYKLKRLNKGVYENNIKQRFIKDDDLQEYYDKNSRYISELLGVDVDFKYIQLLDPAGVNFDYKTTICEYVFHVKNTDKWISCYTNNLINSYEGFYDIVLQVDELIKNKNVKLNRKKADFNKDGKLIMDVIYNYEADVTKKQMSIMDFI